VGSILGEDGDEFADPFEKEAEGDRTQEKPSRERERLTSERQRTAGGGRPTTTTGPRASHEPPRRDDRKRAREADESSERERERNKQPLSSFIGKVWASEETHIESDPERTKEERAKRLRNSSSALPARFDLPNQPADRRIAQPLCPSAATQTPNVSFFHSPFLHSQAGRKCGRASSGFHQTTALSAPGPAGSTGSPPESESEEGLRGRGREQQRATRVSPSSPLHPLEFVSCACTHHTRPT